jgi:Flp pilus assembly protein TadG
MKFGQSRSAKPRDALAARGWGFARDKSGASAIEFALIAWPLILLLLVSFEIGLVFFANASLDNATARAARMIRTGQAQTQGFDAGAFKSQVCKRLSGPIKCGDLKLDVRHYANFAAAASNLTNPLDSSGKLKTSFSYDPGVGGDIVVVRAFYEWPLIAKMPKGIGLSNMNNGDRLLVSTAAFRSEPFTMP